MGRQNTFFSKKNLLSGESILSMGGALLGVLGIAVFGRLAGMEIGWVGSIIAGTAVALATTYVSRATGAGDRVDQWMKEKNIAKGSLEEQKVDTPSQVQSPTKSLTINLNSVELKKQLEDPAALKKYGLTDEQITLIKEYVQQNDQKAYLSILSEDPITKPTYIELGKYGIPEKELSAEEWVIRSQLKDPTYTIPRSEYLLVDHVFRHTPGKPEKPDHIYFENNW